MRVLQVDRIQRRRDLAAAETGRHGDSDGSFATQLRLAPPNGIPSV